jgi:hypothetical protein
MGPTYFIQLRKVQLLGVRIDSTSTQLNFLIDEDQTVGTKFINFNKKHTSLYTKSYMSMHPVRIRVRVDPPHTLVCRKRRLNGTVLRMRPEKPRPHVTAGVAR